MTFKALAAGPRGSALVPPPVIPWHTAAWADDPLWTPPADGGAVASWRDMSGNSRHLVQATAEMRPLYRASVAELNGRAGIQGDGVNDRLTVSFTATTQPYSIVAVGSMLGGTFPALVAGGTLSNGGDMVLLYRSTSGHHKIFAGIADIGPASGDATVHAFRAYFAGASSVLTRDGASSTGNPGTRPISTLHVLGSPYTTANISNAGHIGFVGLYEGDVTSHASWSAFCAWVLDHYGKVLA